MDNFLWVPKVLSNYCIIKWYRNLSNLSKVQMIQYILQHYWLQDVVRIKTKRVWLGESLFLGPEMNVFPRSNHWDWKRGRSARLVCRPTQSPSMDNSKMVHDFLGTEAFFWAPGHWLSTAGTARRHKWAELRPKSWNVEVKSEGLFISKCLKIVLQCFYRRQIISKTQKSQV